MDYAAVTVPNILKGTYSDISKTLPIALLLSLVTPPAIDANSLPILNIWQSQIKYEIKITPQVTCQRSAITLWEVQKTREFQPRTEFVKKLLALRKQAILSGMPLLTVDEILAEKRVLRGEID
jgi:hypothetical protein